MPCSISIVVYGSPKALKRHRIFRVGGSLRAYDPSRGDKSDFIMQIIKCRPPEPLNGKLALSFKFYMPIPKCFPKRLRREGLDVPHVKKPDLDNLIKFCLDAMNNLIYRDDSQIYRIEAVKLYSEKPRTVIEIRGE